MPRLMHFGPVFFAVALSAQVPTPPVTPAPSTPPVVPMPPVRIDLPSMPDMNYITPDPDFTNYTFDMNYTRDMADYSRSIADYTRAATDLALQDFGGFGSFSGFGNGGPIAWAQQDPADSLYRVGRDQLNRGDYRRAAEAFKALPQKYPNSVYVADAQYWQAFSLYRIGGTPELQEALAVLEARKPPAPDSMRGDMGRITRDRQTVNEARAEAAAARDAARASDATASRAGSAPAVSINVGASGINVGRIGWRSEPDAAGLAARIASVLSSRGLASNPSVKRALAAAGNSCDQEDQSVRAEALNALMQNDPATGRQMATKILANRDTCSVPLRRNAVMLVGNGHDDAAAATLIPVAKSDPSAGVRVAAIEYLVRLGTDAAISAVLDIARTDTSAEVQRVAVGALSQSTNVRARSEVRAIVESNTTTESLRLAAIDGFDRDHMTADDAAWLRGLYARTTSARVKERIISAVGRAGGDANNQWLLALVHNEDEPLDSRTEALGRTGSTMDIATLVKMYDVSSERPIREMVIELLSQRREPEALDKLVDVARNGTDPAMRREAIGILARSRDPRAAKLLLQLVDK